jgi:uncharacterized protein (DUF1697 family)
VSTYVAFLRGINLGPTRKVAMPALRAAVGGLGYTDVQTYINSGNVILHTDEPAAEVERALHRLIESEFGFAVDVAVRTPAELTAVLAANPYPDGNPSQVTVAFLTGDPAADAAERMAAVATEHEPFTFADRCVYVHYADGIGTSKLAERFSKVVGVSATVRNIRTVEKVLALSR